jgi:hypothetical protein
MLGCSSVPATGEVSPGACSERRAESSLPLFTTTKPQGGALIWTNHPHKLCHAEKMPPAVVRQEAKFYYEGNMRV